jgi:hypothetical protein
MLEGVSFFYLFVLFSSLVQTIEDGGIQALERKWHASCFSCNKCEKGFEKGFVNVNGTPFHQECLEDNVEVMGDEFLDIKFCKTCSNPLGEERFVQAGGAFYHNKVTRAIYFNKRLNCSLLGIVFQMRHLPAAD